MKITDVRCNCSGCDWSGTVEDCMGDLDGNLCCPDCKMAVDCDDALPGVRADWRVNATIDRLISNIPVVCSVLREHGYVSLAGQLERDRANLVYWQERGDRALQNRGKQVGGMSLKDARRRAIALAKTMNAGIITIYRLRPRQFTFQVGYGPEGNDTVMIVHAKWAKDGYYDEHHPEWVKE